MQDASVRKGEKERAVIDRRWSLDDDDTADSGTATATGKGWEARHTEKETRSEVPGHEGSVRRHLAGLQVHVNGPAMHRIATVRPQPTAQIAQSISSACVRYGIKPTMPSFKSMILFNLPANFWGVFFIMY